MENEKRKDKNLVQKREKMKKNFIGIQTIVRRRKKEKKEKNPE